MRQWCQRYAGLPIVVAYVLFLVGPALRADFGIIDDHNIIRLLGPSGRLAFGELPATMSQEALPPLGRFRPGFQLTQVLETYFFQDHAARWFLGRLAMALLTATALYAAARCVLGPVASAAVAVLFFAGPQSEIWFKLGQGETYANTLVALGAWGIAARLSPARGEGARPSPWVCAPAFLCLLFAGFFKESFIPALPIALVVVYLLLPGPRQWVNTLRSWGKFDWAVVAFLAVGTLVQVSGTLYMVQHYGHVYGGHLSLASILHVARQSLGRFSRDTVWFFPAVVAATFALWHRKPTAWRTHIGSLIGGLVCLGLLILVPQWIFYSTSPDGMGAHRYLTPANWFAVGAVLLGLHHLAVQGSDGPALRPIGGMVCSMLLALSLPVGNHVHQEARSYARSTRHFQAQVAQIVALQASQPAAPLVFHVAQSIDYEPALSLREFLSARLHEDVRPFLICDAQQDAPTELGQRLYASLRELLAPGRVTEVPTAAVAGGSAGVEVLFSTAHPSGVARDVVSVRWK